MATRYSWFLTSLGTPTFTGHSPRAVTRLGVGSQHPTIVTCDPAHSPGRGCGTGATPGTVSGPSCHVLRRAHRAQDVATGQLGEVALGPTPVGQCGEQAW